MSLEKSLFFEQKCVAISGTNFKYMNFLSLVYLTFLLAATIMAYKVVNVWGVEEPGSTLIYTFTFFWGNIYTELYGAEFAKKLIWQSVLAEYIFALLISGVNALPAPSSWDMGNEFNQVIGHILRFTNAGAVGYLLSAFLNVYLLTKWKYKLKGKYFWFRSLFASTVSEATATFIAGIMTFIGMMPMKNILVIMLNAFLFKIIYGLLAVWPTSLIAHILKNLEKPMSGIKKVSGF